MQEKTAKALSALRGCGADLTKAHQFPDDPVTHLDSPHQHQHVENEFTYIVPYDGGYRQRIVRNSRR